MPLSARQPSSQRPESQAPLQQLFWRWVWRSEGGNEATSGEPTWEGPLPELLARLVEWLKAATLSHWAPVESAAVAHGFTLAEGALSTGSVRRAVVGKPCGRCGHTDTAVVSLEVSMLREIWGVPACKMCLACGHTEPLEALTGQRSALDGDLVLEVATTAPLHLKSAKADELERLASRALRVEAGQVSAATPREHQGGAALVPPTDARHRVAHVAISSQSAGIAAAAAVASLHTTTGSDLGDGPFWQDHEWVYSCLHDTGLDLLYGEDRPISADIAIEDIDDRRMMPRRQDVPPLVLWAELKHVLSADFQLKHWIHACFAVLCESKFSLPGAITMKRSIERLRELVGAAPSETPDASAAERIGEADSGEADAAWPLSLHRVLVVRAETSDTVLGGALASVGVRAGGVRALCAEGAQALRQVHEGGTDVPAVMGERASKAAAVAAADRAALDATSIMRDLAHRRLCTAPDSKVGFRAMLRARRLLREIQVSKYLDRLISRITANDNWRDDEGPPEAALAADEGEEEVDDNESESETEDQRGSPRVGARKSEANSEDLLVRKVLGHAKEYVHQKGIIQKALQVLYVIVQTFSSFAASLNESALLKLRSRESAASAGPRRSAGSSTAVGPPLERVLVEQGFVRTALRALYRHHHRPGICTHALALLAHLLLPEHGCRERALHELSHPPEHFLTLALGAGNLNAADHLEPLRICLQVLHTVAGAGSPKDALAAPVMPEGRDPEAAEALLKILEQRVEQEELFVPALELVSCLARAPAMCTAFIGCSLTTRLRLWLLESAAGRLHDRWRKNARQGSEHKLVGPSGRGVRALKQMTGRLLGVRSSVVHVEELMWGLLSSLTRGAPDLEAFLGDALETIEQGLGEMSRESRGSQWPFAIDCLTQVMALERERQLIEDGGRPFSSAFLAGGGLGLLLVELPSGEVAKALPLLREVVDAAERTPPPLQIALDFEMEEEEQQEEQEESEDGQTTSSETALHSSVPDIATADPSEFEDSAAARSPPEQAKAWLVHNKGIDRVLQALTSHTEQEEVSYGLLRVLGELLQMRDTVGKQAALAFRSFGDLQGMGFREVVKAMRHNFDSAELVNAALHAVQGALANDTSMAVVLGNLQDACPSFVDAVWGNLSNEHILSRTVAVLTVVREAVPEQTEAVALKWEEKSRQYQKQHQNSSDVEEDDDGASSHSSILRKWSLVIPRGVRRFGALVCAHRYLRSKGRNPARVVVEAIKDFPQDREICLLSLRGLLAGNTSDLANRVPAVLAVPAFSDGLRVILEQEDTTSELVLLALRLVTAILPAESDQVEEYAEVATLATSTLLDLQPEWRATDWEAMLMAVDMISTVPAGRSCLKRFEILSRLRVEWKKFLSREDELSRVVVRKYKSDTERTLAIFS